MQKDFRLIETHFFSDEKSFLYGERISYKLKTNHKKARPHGARFFNILHINQLRTY